MADALRKHQATNVDELLAGQQRLQAVLDSIDDGLLIIDRQGRLEHLNPVAQRQLGWDTTASAKPGRSAAAPGAGAATAPGAARRQPGAPAGRPEHRGRWRSAPADLQPDPGQPPQGISSAR
jgi:PAS domain-containing protein